MRNKFLDDYIRSIYAEIIRAFIAPLLSRIELIILRSAFIDLLDHLRSLDFEAIEK